MYCTNCGAQADEHFNFCTNCGGAQGHRTSETQGTTGREAGRKPESGLNVLAEGRFEKRRVKPMKEHGRYRGAGRLEVDDAGLRIVGKHVYSLGARWGFGLALFFGVLILTAGTFAPGFLLVYAVVEYWWLKKEELHVPFSAIVGVATNDAKQVVAISFEGYPWCSPVVLKSPHWRAVADALRPQPVSEKIFNRLVYALPLENKKLKTLDDTLTVFQDCDLNSPVIGHPPIDTDIQLGSRSESEGREWIEAAMPNGDRGYVLGASARSHCSQAS